MPIGPGNTSAPRKQPRIPRDTTGRSAETRTAADSPCSSSTNPDERRSARLLPPAANISKLIYGHSPWNRLHYFVNDHKLRHPCSCKLPQISNMQPAECRLLDSSLQMHGGNFASPPKMKFPHRASGYMD